MKSSLKKSGLFFLLFFSLNITAQNGNVAAGGDASGAGGSASYSYGQVVYTTYSVSTGSTAQGVQQAYEISVITDLTEADAAFSEITVFPNPTTDLITLLVRQAGQAEVKYELYDMLGKKLSGEKIETEKINISLLPYASGTYFLKVIGESKEIKTFKIIKN